MTVFLNDSYENITAVIHMGAISSTTERDLNLIVRNNMNFPYMIWKLCSEKKLNLFMLPLQQHMEMEEMVS